jgi:hypothetical protein
MSNKLIAGFVGAIVVVGILALQAVEHWTIVDAVLSGLRDRGPIGGFLVGILKSRTLPLVIALAAIYLVFEGRNERGVATSDKPPATDDARVSRSGNSTAAGGTATATIGDIHVHAGSVVPAPTSQEPKPDDPPVISFEDSLNICILNSGWVFVEHGEGVPTLVGGISEQDQRCWYSHSNRS